MFHGPAHSQPQEGFDQGVRAADEREEREFYFRANKVTSREEFISHPLLTLPHQNTLSSLALNPP